MEATTRLLKEVYKVTVDDRRVLVAATSVDGVKSHHDTIVFLTALEASPMPEVTHEDRLHLLKLWTLDQASEECSMSKAGLLVRIARAEGISSSLPAPLPVVVCEQAYDGRALLVPVAGRTRTHGSRVPT